MLRHGLRLRPDRRAPGPRTPGRVVTISRYTGVGSEFEALRMRHRAVADVPFPAVADPATSTVYVLDGTDLWKVQVRRSTGPAPDDLAHAVRLAKELEMTTDPDLVQEFPDLAGSWAEDDLFIGADLDGRAPQYLTRDLLPGQASASETSGSPAFAPTVRTGSGTTAP